MEEREPKKKKKLSPRRVIGIIIILIGIAVCVYPLAVQAYNKYQQEKMLEEIQAEIEKNQAAALTRTPEPTEATASEPTKAATPELTPKITVEPMMPEPVVTGAGVSEDITPTVSAEPTKEAEPTPEITSEATPEPTKEAGNRLNGQQVIGIIEIEAIDLIYPVVEGADYAEIGVAIGHMTETAAIGEIGNCALAGHRGGYSGPYFEELDELVPGDVIKLTNAFGEEFEYVMTESMIVEPTDVWVVADTGEGKAVLTLITCEDNGAQRLIVRAYLKEDLEEE